LYRLGRNRIFQVQIWLTFVGKSSSAWACVKDFVICSQSDDCPSNNLAKFGYIINMKVNYFIF
jgi:hypothetical protein